MSQRYSDTDIDTALIALILSGSSGQAIKALKAQGLTVPARTLRDWSVKHADRMERLQRDLAPRVAEIVAARAEGIALRIGDVEEALIDKIVGKLADMTADQAAQALRNVTTSKALQYDRISNPVRGRPSLIVERRDPQELLRAIDAIVGYGDDITQTSALPPAAA
jgi:hypothetical protein